MRTAFIIFFVTPVIFSACQNSEKKPSSIASAVSEGKCVATSDDVNKLRATFKETASLIGNGEKVVRAPFAEPFLEPPNVKLTTHSNPKSIEYGWTVKLVEDCVLESVKPGFKLDEIEYSAKINSAGRVVDDNMNIKVSNK